MLEVVPAYRQRCTLIELLTSDNGIENAFEEIPIKNAGRTRAKNKEAKRKAPWTA